MDSDRGQPLEQGWELAFGAPGAAALSHAGAKPLAAAGAQLTLPALDWLPAQVPGTAASALRALGRWTFDDARDFDAEEIWYRLRFAAPKGSGANKSATERLPIESPAQRATQRLRFEGLATLADVWLNGSHLLRSENMFLQHRIEVGDLLLEENELVLRFSSLKQALAQKRARPRWKTKLVEQQQLRWIRTTLLGRIPGWTPPAAAVGPWKGIFLEAGRAPPKLDLRSSLQGTDGVVRARLTLAEGEPAPRAAYLEIGGVRAALEILTNDTNVVTSSKLIELYAELRIPDVQPWWPHTHGAQPLYPVRLVLERDGEPTEILECGRTGFRALELDRAQGNFALRINGIPIFCRGACWTTLDPVTLHGEPAAYRAALEQARDAGMNMLRVGGTMTYEHRAFYELCDELGILVFQDFQFANFDYPAADPAFAASVRSEAEQFLERTQLSPSLAILCGGSEVEQQAAMLGVPTNLSSSPLFTELLPSACAKLRPDVPYVTNSPTGGPLPFTVGEGLSHYYGVGAYLRPLEDARRAEVRFTSECLGLANVPEPSTLDALFADGQSGIVPHHSRWKARVPRDSGAGWDFDDVRDHYLKLLFSQDPTALRWSEPQRYLQLSRAVSGEVMAATLAEWRRVRSSCKGALIWFLRDLWAGAGWGLVDALGKEKAAYWYVKRELQPLALLLTDEGNNGLRLHALNETAQPFTGELRLSLYRDGEHLVAEGKMALEIPPRSELEFWGDALLGRFTDSTWAYRFGPPGHNLAVASLRDSSGALLRQAFYFPLGRPSQREPDLGIEAQLVRAGSGWELRAKSRRFAQAIALEVDGARPDDSWFHLEPGVERAIGLRGASAKAPRVLLEPLNARVPLRAVEPP